MYDLLTREQADLQVRQHPEKGLCLHFFDARNTISVWFPNVSLSSALCYCQFSIFFFQHPPPPNMRPVSYLWVSCWKPFLCFSGWLFGFFGAGVIIRTCFILEICIQLSLILEVLLSFLTKVSCFGVPPNGAFTEQTQSVALFEPNP